MELQRALRASSTWRRPPRSHARWASRKSPPLRKSRIGGDPAPADKVAGNLPSSSIPPLNASLRDFQGRRRRLVTAGWTGGGGELPNGVPAAPHPGAAGTTPVCPRVAKLDRKVKTPEHAT